MPIRLTVIEQGELCLGMSWHVEDKSFLARIVADVALGQYRQAAKIMAGATGTPIAAHASAVEDALKLLTVAPGEDPWHRDGWIFQVMSWVTAMKVSRSAIRQPPHIILAHKGFDGLELEFTHDKKHLKTAIIYEDKATENARDTIRDDVWPSIKKMEGGHKSNELLSTITSLLETARHLTEDECQEILNSLIWDQLRSYRVSISIADTHNSINGHKKLFKGFDEVVKGHLSRRRGEVCYLPTLRNWMADIAEEVKKIIRGKGELNVR